jgi:hypothetical protein
MWTAPKRATPLIHVTPKPFDVPPIKYIATTLKPTVNNIYGYGGMG